jgi:hypothetical protein
LSATIVAVSAVNIATIRLAASGLTIAGDAERAVQERAIAGVARNADAWLTIPVD